MLKAPYMIHGCDYNPEQWLDTPKILDEDMRLMQLSTINSVSVGIFSWVSLEPEEGVFNFSWLDDIFERMEKIGNKIVLATPSGARPHWLAQKYPEVLRTDTSRVKQLYGNRHNHCFTSPVYREKVRIINEKLARRYKDSPALILWHLSNEYSGECHCPLCQEAFRKFLQKKYNNDLDKLNREYWSTFWSHTYTDWSQIESPSPIGETSVHGLNLDWKRFVTEQTMDFIRMEKESVQKYTPNIPVTANLMGTYSGLNYQKLAKELDLVSWDNYPAWHKNGADDTQTAVETAFVHDFMRGCGSNKPFYLMESAVTCSTWQPVPKLKRPKMHKLSSLQAVAHGSDSVQYFQWRKSRGCIEKLHSAIIDHCGHENTRAFRDVQETGEALKKLDTVIGSIIKPQVAILYDTENRWAYEDSVGIIGKQPGDEWTDTKDYVKTATLHYRPFWENGINVDVVSEEDDYSQYKILIAPLFYMVKEETAERIKRFVKNGGLFVTTYFSGLVNENDLVYEGGLPGPLSDLCGVWAEDTDALYPDDKVKIIPEKDAPFALKNMYIAEKTCEIIHAKGAKVLASYGNEFYAGMPALTENTYGNGKAYYIAFRNDTDFLNDFYQELIKVTCIKNPLRTQLPYGVTVSKRENEKQEFLFIQNFVDKEVKVDFGNKPMLELLSGRAISGMITLEGYGILVLQRDK